MFSDLSLVSQFSASIHSEWMCALDTPNLYHSTHIVNSLLDTLNSKIEIIGITYQLIVGPILLEGFKGPLRPHGALVKVTEPHTTEF